MNDSTRRLRIAAALLVGILCAGSLGYALIEDFTALEAFYMTIITVSTVGFGEVRELTDLGKLFTAGLILSSIGTFTFAATAVTRFFVEGNYRDRLRARRIEKIMNEKNKNCLQETKLAQNSPTPKTCSSCGSSGPILSPTL